MEPLPILASCSLNQVELTEQLERYRTAGEDADIIERQRRRSVIRISEAVPDGVIEKLISVERGCCPFFDLDWQPSARRLTIVVPSAEHEPALDAISYALGISETSPG